MATPFIALEFVLGVAYARGLAADLPAVLIICVVSVLDVDMLTDDNGNGS